MIETQLEKMKSAVTQAIDEYMDEFNKFKAKYAPTAQSCCTLGRGHGSGGRALARTLGAVTANRNALLCDWTLRWGGWAVGSFAGTTRWRGFVSLNHRPCPGPRRRHLDNVPERGMVQTIKTIVTMNCESCPHCFRG